MKLSKYPDPMQPLAAKIKEDCPARNRTLGLKRLLISTRFALKPSLMLDPKLRREKESIKYLQVKI